MCFLFHLRFGIIRFSDGTNLTMGTLSRLMCTQRRCGNQTYSFTTSKLGCTLYWSFLNTFVQVCLSSSSWLPTCPCPPLLRELSLCPFSCLLFVLPLLSALPGLSVCLVLPVLSVVYVFSVYPSCLSIFLVLSTLSVSQSDLSYLSVLHAYLECRLRLFCMSFLSVLLFASVLYVMSVVPPFCVLRELSVLSVLSVLSTFLVSIMTIIF